MPVLPARPDGERFLTPLKYDQKSGVFTWTESRGKGRKGAVAGSLGANGYIRIAFGGVRVPAHRLAWFFVHRRWPEQFIDHINGDRADNRIVNLREATESQNQGNQRLKKTSTSRIKGVRARAGKWDAAIREKGRIKHLGRFDTPEAARAAYVTASKHVFGAFARAE